MRIVHIGIDYNPNRGGGNLRNSRILEEFVKIRKESSVTLISYSYKNFTFEKKKTDQLEVIYTNNIFLQICYLLKILFLRGIDIVHCHNARVYTLLKLLHFNLKYVLELHGLHELSPGKEMLFRQFINKTDKIIILGNNGLEVIKKKYRIPAGKIKTLLNGCINGVVPEIKQASSGQWIVSYIGTFYDWQGVFNFVEAIRIFVKKYDAANVQFYFIGGGKEFERVSELIKKYQLSKYITLTGHIAPQEIEKYWKLSDIVVIPRPSTLATETTVPLKLLDAFAYGKFVIGSDVKGVTEMVKHNQNGIIYKHDRIEDLSDAIHTSITDRLLFDRITANAVEFCSQLPDWRQTAEKLDGIYQEVLNEKLYGT